MPPSSYDFPATPNERFRFQEPEFLDAAIANNLCLEGTFDAITLLSDGYTYVFKDAYVYKFDNNFVMDKEYPRLINSVFKVRLFFIQIKKLFFYRNIHFIFSLIYLFKKFNNFFL